MKKIKVKIDTNFKDLLGEFSFDQFYELCRIFEIDMVDRQSVRDIALEATKSGEKMDFSQVKMRRDFDVMADELVAAYNKQNRAMRRKIDKIIETVVRANRQARTMQQKTLSEQYNAAIDKIEEVQQLHNSTINNTEENSTSADMAAEATEG